MRFARSVRKHRIASWWRIDEDYVGTAVDEVTSNDVPVRPQNHRELLALAAPQVREIEHCLVLVLRVPRCRERGRGNPSN